MDPIEQKADTKIKWETIVMKAMDGGFECDLASADENRAKIFTDVKFWEALGTINKWGEWTLNLEDVKHEFEVEYYKADENKTPIYGCKVCMARKENDDITLDLEGDHLFEPVVAGEKTGQQVVKAHGGYKKEMWQTKSYFFWQMYIVKGWDSAVFWLLNNLA